MNPSDSRYGLRRFRFLIHSSRWSPHHRTGSPALGNKSSITCRPCYPERRCAPLPLFQRTSSDLPLLTTGSASPIVLTRLRVGSLALRPALLLFGNSRQRVTTMPLPHATGAYGQLPGRDFNPLDLLLLLRTVRPILYSSIHRPLSPGGGSPSTIGSKGILEAAQRRRE